MKLVIFILSIVYCMHCYAINLPKSNNIPGGIAIVPITAVYKPKVFFRNHRVMVIKIRKKWLAIAGIPLTTKPGKIYLNINNEHKIPVLIKGKKYAKDYITIKNEHLVTPNKSDLSRIYKERKIINNALATWSKKPSTNMHFIWPVKGRISTPFGKHRYYNGQPRSQHSGLDIAVPEGTPIKAAASGKIVLAGNYFFMGNAVIIDHGEGLLSIYCHLSKIKVAVGEKVARGKIIGLVGHTGRATGPHLHWGVKLNDTAVNPNLFIMGM